MAKQDKRPERFDVAADAKPLTDNPFARLGAGIPEPPQETPAPPAEPKSGFRIERTRKGGFPLFLEKRPSGKSVTVIRNVSGDVDSLLVRLKKLCGAGGTLRDDAIEIQGDHRERIEAYLREHAGK